MTLEKWKSVAARPAFLLSAGVVLIVLSNLRWGIGMLAWLAPVPLLRFLRVSEGRRSRVWFVVALSLAWVLATAKIVSAPLPWFFAVLGVPFGLLAAVGYLLANHVRTKRGEARAVLAFPATMVCIEFAQHRFTHLGSWGSAAYTQLDDLPLLQLASLTGIAGVSFMVYLFAACLESLWSQPSVQTRRRLFAAFALVALVHVFGAARLARVNPGTNRVAAIGTDARFDIAHIPDATARARTLQGLLANTERAAQAGARLAVWTEAAALVMPEEEAAFSQAIQQRAKASRIQVVAAYVVLLSQKPLRFENKYRWLRADGSLDHTYFKHEPAPGEPAVVGTGALVSLDSELGRTAGALCYDYDFPALAREHGRLGVDLVALPSSDWRGIDPIHTQMAAVRAIEQGFSIVRSTRFGLTAGIDPLGRMHAQASSFDGGDPMLTVDLPRHGQPTLYRTFGDVFVLFSLLLLALFLLPLPLGEGWGEGLAPASTPK